MNNEKNSPLIQIEDLKKYYPIKSGIITHTTGFVKAVDGVSFSIGEGETLGLVGESGCGKSTIGRQLVGLEKPTAGTIYYKGRNLNSLKKDEMKQIRTCLQMVFQDPYSSLNPRKHIYEILAKPMLYHRISTKETVEKDIVRILDMVGLSRNVLGRYPHEFSGGQRQRIGIAKALSLNPEFIVCDEPVSALDVSIQAQILNLLRSLQKELNLTLLFVGHGLGAVNYVSDRIAVMYAGKIVEYGTAEEVFYNPQHPYTWALLSSMPDLDTNEKLDAIPGTPPNMIYPPVGDAFAERNKYALEIDYEMQPPMFEVSPTHYAATWLLHPNAPKVEIPKIITERIKRMKERGGNYGEQ